MSLAVKLTLTSNRQASCLRAELLRLVDLNHVKALTLIGFGFYRKGNSLKVGKTDADSSMAF